MFRRNIQHNTTAATHRGDLDESSGNRRIPKDEADVPEGAMLVKFQARPFIYNQRLWFAVLPCLLVLLGFVGKPMLACITIGFLITYIFDVSGMRRGTLLSLWATILSAELVLFINCFMLLRQSWSFTFVLLLYNFGGFTALVGAWGTLQFTWFIRDSPNSVVRMERAMFFLFPVMCFVILGWAFIGFFGPTATCFYLVLVSQFLFYIFGRPAVSSFRFPIRSSTLGTSKSFGFNEGYILNGNEVKVLIIILQLAPTLLFFAFNYRGIFKKQEATMLLSFLFLLLSITFSCLYFWTKKGNLWFLSEKYSRESVASFFLVLGFLFFGYALVSAGYSNAAHIYFSNVEWTIICYGYYVALLGAISKFIFHQKLSPFVQFVIILLLNVLGGFIMQANVLVWALLSISNIAGVSALFYRRNVVVYVIFVISVLGNIFLYFSQNVLYLEYSFRMANISLSNFALLAIALSAFSLLLCAPMILEWEINTTRSYLDFVVTVHGILLSLVEKILFGESEGMYPAYLVLTTSVIGCYSCLRFLDRQQISLNGAWISFCMYVAKLCIIFNASNLDIFATFMLLLSVSSYSYFYIYPRMTIRKGVVYALTSGLSTFVTRKQLPTWLLLLILGQKPNSAIYLAAFFLFWGFSLIPLSYGFFSHLTNPKKVNLLLILKGVALAWIQPELDLTSLFSKGSSSVSALSTQITWPSYPLFFGLAVNMVVLLQLVPLNQSFLWRFLYAIVSGACTALYICGQYLPYHAAPVSLYILYTLGLSLAFLTFITLVYPDKNSHWISTSSFFWSCIMYFAIFLAQNGAFRKFRSTRYHDIVEEAQLILTGLYAIMNFLLALVIKYQLSKLSMTSQHPHPGGYKPVRVHHQAVFATLYEWSAIMGNVATLSCFCLALGLSSRFYHGTALIIYLLSPLFLLLNRDTILLKNLNSRNRYLPIMLIILAYLVMNSTHDILRYVLLYLSKVRDITFSALLLYLIKNIGLLILTLPCNYYFCLFLLDRRYQSTFLWLAITPINLVPLFFADNLSTSLLAATSIFVAFIRYWVAAGLRKESLRYI